MIPAGRSGKLTAKVHTSPTQNGSLRKSISVATDAPEAKSLRLTLAFKVESVINVTPRSRLYLHGILGSPMTSRVLMHRADGEPLEITAVRFEDPDIKVRAVPVNADDGEGRPGFDPQAGDVWLEATIDSDVAAGQRSGNVWVSTNHPKMKELQIPVSMRVRPILEARPDNVRLWIMDDGKDSRGSMFRLTNNEGQAFEIKGITVGDEELVTATLLGEGPSSSHNIKVDVAEAAVAEGISIPRQTDLVISTTNLKQPEVTVSVTVAVRQTPPRRVAPQMGIHAGQKVVPRPLPTGTPNARPLKPEGEKD